MWEWCVVERGSGETGRGGGRGGGGLDDMLRWNQGGDEMSRYHTHHHICLVRVKRTRWEITCLPGPVRYFPSCRAARCACGWAAVVVLLGWVSLGGEGGSQLLWRMRCAVGRG